MPEGVSIQADNFAGVQAGTCADALLWLNGGKERKKKKKKKRKV